jgi:hypothetical protein
MTFPGTRELAFPGRGRSIAASSRASRSPRKARCPRCARPIGARAGRPLPERPSALGTSWPGTPTIRFGSSSSLALWVSAQGRRLQLTPQIGRFPGRAGTRPMDPWASVQFATSVRLPPFEKPDRTAAEQHANHVDCDCARALAGGHSPHRPRADAVSGRPAMVEALAVGGSYRATARLSIS